MAKLSGLKARIHSLGEIKSILGAMKNLSIIEMNKISRFLEAQQKTSAAAEEAIADFQDFYGHPQESRVEGGEKLLVLVGSERGFCGAFNETLVNALEGAVEGAPCRFLTVGRKLALKLAGDSRWAGALSGPNTAEEISGVITQLSLQLADHPGAQWRILYHEDGEAPSQVSVLVLFESLSTARGQAHRFPPLLHVPPSELYPQLLEQYLFFLLYKVFYSSFMAENRQRLQHMEGAIQALERDWDRLMLRFNSLRQEEITEDLEVILLNSPA